VRRELDEVKGFCNIVLSKSKIDFLQGMLDIFENALELDEIFMKSKAFSSQTIVDFIVSPLLKKSGNAAGCNYDDAMVLCKASVVCR